MLLWEFVYLPFNIIFIFIIFGIYFYTKKTHLVVIFFLCLFISSFLNFFLLNTHNSLTFLPKFSLAFWHPFGIFFLLFFSSAFLLFREWLITKEKPPKKKLTSKNEIRNIIMEMSQKDNLKEDIFAKKADLYQKVCTSNLKVWNTYFDYLKQASTYFILASIFIGFLCVCSYWLYAYFYENQIWMLWNNTFSTNVLNNQELLVLLKVSKEELSQAVHEISKLKVYFPSFLFAITSLVYLMSTSIINWLVHRFMSKEVKYSFPISIIYFSISDFIIIPFLVVLMGSALVYYLNYQFLIYLFFNLLFIFCILYFLQGIAISKLYLEIRLLSAQLLFSLIFLISLFSIYFLIFIFTSLTIIGLLNFYFNFQGKILDHKFT